jgi:UDP-N-acetylglucosamine/UDP-N-acetylgalactosamine diphosphorylase
MKARGVEYVSQYCVDNALVKVGDPEFVGFCAGRRADCGAKVVAKKGPHEKVGVVMLRGGKPSVVEYSEIDAATAERTGADGRLVFSASHICVNFFSRLFLERCASDLVREMPLHVARKKIPYVDGAGVAVAPEAPNGVKLELFIFDTFPFAARFAALEGARADDFAPVKNAPGPNSTDSPDTARALLSDYHRAWLEKAGATVAPGLVEVAPALSYDGEGLAHLAGTDVAAGSCVAP